MPDPNLPAGGNTSPSKPAHSRVPDRQVVFRSCYLCDRPELDPRTHAPRPLTPAQACSPVERRRRCTTCGGTLFGEIETVRTITEPCPFDADPPPRGRPSRVTLAARLAREQAALLNLEPVP